MHTLSTLRGRYGSKVFVTYLPDGMQVPWRPLDIGEYLDFQNTLATGQYARAYIEDEIFRKCVLDEGLIAKLDKLKAGTVSTVTATIMAYSGPQNSDELNFALNFSRQTSDQVLHHMVPLICQAFPAYKPEEVYAMDYETFMMRLAQSERKLLQLGQLQEPISFSDSSQEEQPKKTPNIPIKELRDVWEEQRDGPRQPPKPKPVPKPLRPTAGQTIITAQDAAEHTLAYTGHEMEDRILLEHDMVKETSPIYKEYQEQAARGEKVRIKSVEERLAEAKVRMAENERKYKEAMKLRAKHNESLADMVAQAASKKR